MKYSVKVTKQAEKFLEKIPQRDFLKLMQIIQALSVNPRPRWIEKIKGSDKPIFRVAWGSYRIIYTIEDHILLVTIVDVNHRKDVYRNL